MLKEQVWRCFYEDGFVDVRRRTRPKSSPFPHKGELVRIEEVEEPKAETLEEAWEAITNEVKAYAQEMEYTHRNVNTIHTKYAAVYELSQSWEYANRSDNPLHKLRCLFLQNWLHYGRDGGYDSCIPHVSIIASLIQHVLHAQLRDTKEEILERISALVSSQSSEVNEIAAWVLFALKQAASPRYGRQHIVDVCIVQLMNALRREDQSRGDILVNGILTELWNALFVEEKR
jgi:hypothetical protein